MSGEVRALIDLSLALALSDAAQLEAALGAALVAAAPDAVEEALLQSYLFLGFPAALRGLAAWRRISGMPAPPAAPADLVEWEQRGAATCERVYGGQYARLRENVAALHPDVERWMIVEGYGKVLSRPALPLVTRELCIIALLAPQDAAPQLFSHLRGALNAGASIRFLGEVVERVAAGLPAARSAALQREWQAVQGRWQVSSEG